MLTAVWLSLVFDCFGVLGVWSRGIGEGSGEGGLLESVCPCVGT